MKYEKERDTEVLELCLQCRLLLGVEGGIAITDTLDVPFFRQSEPDNCVQANMKMALKWCFPDREYSFERLDELTGRRPGSWTWPSQAVAALAKERVDVRLFSSGPWEEILAGGEAFLRGHFEPGTAEIVLSKTDLPALMQSLEALRDSEILQRRTLSGGEVREAFLRDELVLLPIDYARISPFPGVNAESRAYSGHMVLVTGWGQHHVRIHDSLGIADKIVQTFQLFDAWGAPGADNDVILIRGATAAQE